MPDDSVLSDEAVQADVRSQININLVTTGVACYAMQHCDVPVVRRLEIGNTGDSVLTDLTVEITGDPAFFEPQSRRIGQLQCGQVVSLIKGDLPLKHSYLRSLNEAVRGALNIRVLHDGKEIHRHDEPFEVLSFDQWPGTRILPELVAAFSLPNDKHIEHLLRTSSDYLKRSTGNGTLNGYQMGNRKRVAEQMAAIYAAVASKDIRYITAPASFHEGQKIRLPERILETQLGTCLDLTLLFAACLEQAGINPVILFKKGHSCVGGWLVNTGFSADLVDDIVSVRSRIDAGELLVFETTLAAQSGTSFKAAIREAKEHFSEQEESNFECAIEVRRARGHKITPLPTTANPNDTQLIESGAALAVDTSIDDIDLPPLTVDIDDSTSEDKPSTPEGRLARWKAKLLDLTLRNKLLNFKDNISSVVPLIIPRPEELEDAVARGEILKFKPLPDTLMAGSPRSATAYSAQQHRDLYEDVAQETLNAGGLLAGIGSQELEKRLTKIFRDARTAEEEGGANTLFIALGCLRWKKSDDADASHIAPLILVPVTIERPRVRGQFTLKGRDEDTIVNPTLLQMLQREFQIKVLDPENLPTDSHGVDVAMIWQLFRKAVQDMKGWEVLKDVYIGLFSFTKYLMWKDLESRTDDLMESVTVRHLIERSGMEHIDNFPDVYRLDDERDPAQTFCPMLCDSSQLASIYAAAEDKSFVIEGPPGTGKSQTITNIIAHCAGVGKRVLFLSEKITALDVVKRRLVNEGLGPFLLELHSSKGGKSDFARSITSTIENSTVSTVSEWETKARELKRLRDELNGYVRILHKKYRNGLTPFDAIAGTVAHKDWVAAGFNWRSASEHTMEHLMALRELARDIGKVATVVGEIANHPYTEVRRQEWTPGWEAEFIQETEHVKDSLTALIAKIPAMCKLVGIPADGIALSDLEAMDRLGMAILSSVAIAPGIRDVSLGQSKVQRMLERLEEWQAKYAKAVGEVEHVLKTDSLRGFSVELDMPWAIAKAAWFPKSWFAKRGIRRLLAPYSISGESPDEPTFETLLEPLKRIIESDKEMSALQLEARTRDLMNSDGKDIAAATDEVNRTRAWLSGVHASAHQLAKGDLSLTESIQSKLKAVLNSDPSVLSRVGVVGKTVSDFRTAWSTFSGAIADLKSVDGPDYFGNADFWTRAGGVIALMGNLKAMLSRRTHLREWCGWNRYSSRALEVGLGRMIERLVSGAAPSEKIPEYFEFSYRDWFVRKAFDEEPVLSGFLSSVHEQRIEDYCKLDDEFAKLTRQYLHAKLSARAQCRDEVPKEELALLNHQAQLQRSHKSVRYMVEKIPETLKRVKPIMLMSPLSVAQYLDASNTHFDLVIMDEASQIPVWDAVGAIARGKQVIVVGDTKQLPPTNFFNSAGNVTIDDGGYEDLESILDECIAAGLPKQRLKWHYRSRHESLIAFSNQQYYENELITFPSPVTNDRAVSYRYVEGSYDRGGSRTNRAEAEAVADYVAEHYSDPDRRNKSVGVVAFSQAQEQLILDLVDSRRRENKVFDEHCEANENEPLMVKNLESVQGDERDIILFSIGYGPDINNKITYNMGPLNRDGGHRRLNVAVTRARESVVVFSSLRGDDLSPNRVKAQGVNDLKKYLTYAEKGLRALHEIAMPTGHGYDSPFERQVANEIRRYGYEVIPQVGVSEYRIDLGVVDPSAPGRFLLGIECDGAMYHSAATARERDRLRQMVLEGLGWKIARIWSTDWWSNPNREIEKILNRIKELESSSSSNVAAGEDHGEAAETSA